MAVFERRGIVGGAAVTEEFHPGFRNSTASYTVSLLHPKVIRDLRLAERGLTIVERPLANFLPLPDGGYLKVGGGIASTQAEVARFSRKDADALPAYYAMLDGVADVLRSLLLETPPNVGAGVHELFAAWKVGGKLKRLGPAQRRDLLDLFTKSAGDVLDRWFEAAPLKAALGFDAVVGNFASPYTPGSAYVLLHHVFGEINGKRGQWGHALGGMGAITGAMAAEARARGVEIHTDCAVARVLTRSGRAIGIALDDGTEIAARRVVANVNPKLLYLQLIDPGCARCRLSAAHPQLPLRVGDLSHERRAGCLARFRLPARRRGAPEVGHHRRAVAWLHGARVFRRAHARLVARADRRDARSIDASTRRSRRRASMWRACSASMPTPSCPTAGHGTR